MRAFSALQLLPLVSLFSLTAVAAPADVPPSADAAAEDEAGKPTYFNGKPVPPMTELSGPTFKEDISHGYWMVEGFSPYCSHCKRLAPKLQTAYEFYYTSQPIANSDASFSALYDYTFAKLDCIAFSDTCNSLEIKSFPTLMLFKDGKEIKRVNGDRSMAHLSEFIEEGLELIKPGTRPEGGPTLPAVGASNDGGLNKPIEMPSEKKSPVGGAVNSKGAAAAAAAAKAAILPNPDGKSVNFTRDTFEQRVIKTTDPWWIKFYAPWCHHCQAMAPAWASMAREMQDQLNIGDVDCTVERALCKEHGVDAYPHVMMFHGTERIPYDGLRGLGDLISYAKHAVDAFAGVEEVDEDSYAKLEEEHEVIFTYFYDHATTSEDFLALERLPAHVIPNAKLVKSQDSNLAKRFKVFTWPKLIVSRNGIPSFYPGASPQTIRNVDKLIDWIHHNWLPLVPELTAQNARELMEDEILVLGVLYRERSDEFVVARRELKNAAIEWMEKQEKAFEIERQELRDAKQLRIEEAEDRKDVDALRDAKQIRIKSDDIRQRNVRFAWVDGVFWERWLRSTFGVHTSEGERVIINDQENMHYWDLAATGNIITPSRTSILDTLPKVLSRPPRLQPKGVGSLVTRFFHSLWKFFKHNPVTAITLSILGLLAVFAIWRAIRRRGGFRAVLGSRSSYGYFRVGDESLLGAVTGQPNGKAD